MSGRNIEGVPRGRFTAVGMQFRAAATPTPTTAARVRLINWILVDGLCVGEKLKVLPFIVYFLLAEL